MVERPVLNCSVGPNIKFPEKALISANKTRDINFAAQFIYTKKINYN
jgi:hypothetical protein